MEPRACVLVPVYNHALTVGRVVREARAHLPVFAIDDGSTDHTASELDREPGIERISWKTNQGKGAALRAGFEKAQAAGFTHAITIDADGQHPVSALPDFVAALQREPEALITGVRDFARAKAPLLRRASNALSNFWFRIETGVPLSDTQCGYRSYPITPIRSLNVTTERYAFELELLVRAAWANFPIRSLPIAVDYSAPTSQLSHFDPLRDFLRISRIHARLTRLALSRRPRP